MSATALDTSLRYRVAGWPGVAVYVAGFETEQPECAGHPDDGEFNGPAGETFYCDGSCEDPRETGMVYAVMVGDDRRHLVDADDLEPLDDLDYCEGCGQIGCGHDGRER